MKRMTRTLDKYPCRIINCRAEEWIENIVNHSLPYGVVCDNCPFEAYINKLAEFEDEKENERSKQIR